MMKPSQLSRREVLGLGAAALAASVIAPSVGAAEEETNDIDAHVHVWTSDLDKYPINSDYKREEMQPASFTAEDLFKFSKPNGVDRIVLIQMSYYKYDNSYMLDTLARFPEVFRAVAQIDENRPDLRDAVLKHVGQGVRGYRVWTSKETCAKWDATPGMQKLWDLGAETGVKICLLANPDTLPIIYERCKKNPKTPVVIDHMCRIGMTGTVEPEEADNLCKLADFENVYVKTSAFYALGAKMPPYTDLGPLIRKLRDAFGASRLMWASDCPYQVEKGNSYDASINLIRSGLDFLSAEDRRWMLRDTAEKVFFS